MDGSANFTPTETEVEREPPAAETTSASAPEKLAESSGSPSPAAPAQAQGTAQGAAGASIKEENITQTSAKKYQTKCLPHTSSSESTGTASVYSALSFPQKLWLVVESDQFETIWWGRTGNSVNIKEAMFPLEVLGRRGPQRIFELESMKSFTHQLNLYGLTEVPCDATRPPSLPGFLAKEEAFAAHRKVPQLLHTRTNSQHSGGRDAGSNIISIGAKGGEDDSKCSDSHFFLCLFACSLEVVWLSFDMR